MEPTKNAKGFGSTIRAWIDHLGDELGFADGRFFDVSRGKELEFAGRSQPREFEYIDDEDVIFKSSDVILDVGSGALPKFGNLIQGKQIDYRPVDPLAYEYQKLHDKYKIESPCDTLFGFMEILSAFIPENTADFVICHNAMDHSIDAPRSLMECLKVAKVGGTVLLNHAQCEAENADYRGLHQWNITVEKQDLIFYSKQDRYNISSLISCFCDVVIKQTEDSHSGKEMIHAKILKKSNVPVEIKEKYDTAAYAGYIISAIMNKMADKNTIYRPSGENVIPDNTKYIIFGIGQAGRECLAWFGKRNKQILYCIDNSVTGTADKVWNGYVVKNPKEYRKGDGLIIIASKKYEHDMVEQLLHMGLQQGMDFLPLGELKKKLMV